MADLTLRGASGQPVGETLYTRVGGHDTFVKLVDHFYAAVISDPVLRPMYPDEDLDGARWRLTAFLEQYWGGPSTYSEQRGHPRLRMRHAPFPIGPSARDHWLSHMRDALTSLELSPLDDAMLWDYLERAAHAMLMRADDPPGGNHDDRRS